MLPEARASDETSGHRTQTVLYLFRYRLRATVTTFLPEATVTAVVHSRIYVNTTLSHIGFHLRVKYLYQQEFEHNNNGYKSYTLFQ